MLADEVRKVYLITTIPEPPAPAPVVELIHPALFAPPPPPPAPVLAVPAVFDAVPPEAALEVPEAVQPVPAPPPA